jgi:hypothetical protein
LAVALSFITIAKEQKSISLEKRAEATYEECRRQKAGGSGGPRNTIAKKQTGQEDADSDYLFGDCSRRAVSRFGCGSPALSNKRLNAPADFTRKEC